MHTDRSRPWIRAAAGWKRARGPRVGFAYSIDDKTVVRGGFGLFYDRIQGNPTFYSLANPPYVSSISYNYGDMANITRGRAPAASFAAIQTIQPNLRTPYSEQF